VQSGVIVRQAFLVLEGWAGDGTGCVGPGEVVGDVALLAVLPAAATVTAITPMQVLVAGPSAYRALVAVAPVAAQLGVHLRLGA
jgi:CRP-like cAMP-binding protein